MYYFLFISCFSYFTVFYCFLIFFFFNDTATTEIYTLSLHDALPICHHGDARRHRPRCLGCRPDRSEEHTSELQSRLHLVCRLLLEKKKKKLTRVQIKKKKKSINTQKYTSKNK